ncbi:MAG TPA: hypothetical protein VJ810_23230 [Blastocatellia bacterium]|nr:hypothetical protein [Blastocatellia bacterium]
MSEDITTNVVNEVAVTIIDADRAMHDAMPTGMADVVLAALTAEPETLEELEVAVGRYDRPVVNHGFLKHLNSGVSEKPWDAGLIIVDLPARLIVAATEPALYEPDVHGFALYCPDPPPDSSEVSEEDLVWLPFRLSKDWLLIRSLEDWRAVSEQRRRARAGIPLFDARSVLFGKVSEFIAGQCRVARGAGMDDPIAAIHEGWLMTPRDDLRGQTPREALLSDLEYIDWDIESRARQWSFTGQCPAPLKPDSIAYRYAGFGTHSNVVYFDLLRFLLRECWERMDADPSAALSDVVAQLERLRDEWMKECGDFNHSHGWIMEQERLRIPVTASPQEVLMDPDCDMCQWAADPDFGPTFWRLDGSEMDLENNWVFSFHLTRESWEAERRKWEEHRRKFNEEQSQRRAEIEWAGGARIFDDRKATEENDEDDAPFRS